MSIIKVRYFTNEEETKLQIINKSNNNNFEDLQLSKNKDKLSLNINFEHDNIFLIDINMPYKEVEEKVVNKLSNFMEYSNNATSTIEISVFSKLEDKKEEGIFARSYIRGGKHV